jgi:hypothetical protein
MTTNESPFACDMSAIEPGDRPKHLATIETLFGMVQEITELPNGYAFRLPGESHVWRLASDFVALERLCCPFFDLNLGVEREHGSIHLSLTGREGVKPFIIAEVGRHLTQIRHQST